MKEKRYFDQSYSSIFKGLAGVIFLIFFFLGLYLANRYNSWVLFPASALVGLIVTMPTFALGEAIQYVACSYDILHHLESIGYDVNYPRGRAPGIVDNKETIMAVLDIDMKGPFDITAPTNSVNGNEYLRKTRGYVGIGKQNGFEYYAYVREGNKLRPMTMKELKGSETLKKIVEDIKRHKGESIENFQVHCADGKMTYNMDEKFLRNVPSSDYEKMWQKTHLEDIAKKNGLTPFSRENLKNHENLHEWLEESTKHKSSKHDRGR